MKTMRALVPAFALAACGQPAPPPEAPAAAPSNSAADADQGWDVRVAQFIPQIDPCLAASPQTRNVNYAGERDGAVLIRMSGEGDEIDCTVGDGVARTAPRDASISVAGEGAAIFVRGPGENPGGECYEAPEVKSASGELLGWWLDPAGC